MYLLLKLVVVRCHVSLPEGRSLKGKGMVKRMDYLVRGETPVTSLGCWTGIALIVISGPLAMILEQPAW